MRRTIHLFLLSALLASVAYAQILQAILGDSHPLNAGPYTYHRTITLSKTLVASSQTNFDIPICFNATGCSTVAGMNQQGAGSHVLNLDGSGRPADLVFSFTDPTCSGGLAAWEVETYVASTGEGHFWVLVPTYSSSVDTSLYMCYGSAGVTTFQGGPASAVHPGWTMIQHMQQATNAQAIDATGNSNNSTSASATQVAGKIGLAQQFAGSSDQITIPAIAAALNMGQGVLSFWYRRAVTSGLVTVGPSNQPQTFRFFLQAYSDGGTYMGLDGPCYGTISPAPANDTNWHKLDAVFDGTQSTTTTRFVPYFDGGQRSFNLAGGSVGTNTLVTNEPFLIGKDAFTGNSANGLIDEVRFAVGTVFNPDRFPAAYNIENTPTTYVTFGTEH